MSTLQRLLPFTCGRELDTVTISGTLNVKKI